MERWQGQTALPFWHAIFLSSFWPAKKKVLHPSHRLLTDSHCSSLCWGGSVAHYQRIGWRNDSPGKEGNETQKERRWTFRTRRAEQSRSQRDLDRAELERGRENCCQLAGRNINTPDEASSSYNCRAIQLARRRNGPANEPEANERARARASSF